MKNQTLSIVAFSGAALLMAGFIFKMIPVGTALKYGAILVAVGYITQPTTEQQAV